MPPLAQAEGMFQRISGGFGDEQHHRRDLTKRQGDTSRIDGDLDGQVAKQIGEDIVQQWRHAALELGGIVHAAVQLAAGADAGGRILEHRGRILAIADLAAGHDQHAGDELQGVGDTMLQLAEQGFLLADEAVIGADGGQQSGDERDVEAGDRQIEEHRDGFFRRWQAPCEGGRG